MSLSPKQLQMIRALPESAEKCFTTIFETNPDLFDKYVKAIQQGLKVGMTSFPKYIAPLNNAEKNLSLTIRSLMLSEDQEPFRKYMKEVTKEELINVRRIIFNSHIF
jgi:hypothetical protein